MLLLVLMIIALMGLIRCMVVLGIELFNEYHREAEERKAAKEAAIEFRGKSWIEEELIIRRLLKSGR